ncbi:hypothetical protein CGRA01v4_02420 [Colletotrichum graminicola]|nr:hypothetical protein CGRA01v4_02420 [Colletotrichum graminicola]
MHHNLYLEARFRAYGVQSTWKLDPRDPHWGRGQHAAPSRAFDTHVAHTICYHGSPLALGSPWLAAGMRGGRDILSPLIARPVPKSLVAPRHAASSLLQHGGGGVPRQQAPAAFELQHTYVCSPPPPETQISVLIQTRNRNEFGSCLSWSPMQWALVH